MICVAGKIAFTTKYGGKAVTGLAGASVNFTWSFSGVKSVEWGLKADGGKFIEDGGVLVFLDQNGPVSIPVPPAYSGRVNGRGDASSGQVIFTLSQISTSDERSYGCKISPTAGFDDQKFDSVYLTVNGEYLLA